VTGERRRRRQETGLLALRTGDDGARRRLAHWLARLRERGSSGDGHARQLLAEWES